MVVNTKWVYGFHEVDELQQSLKGDWDAVRGLLGGKGANLGDMSRLGVPVPPGFTITTEACNAYDAADGVMPAGQAVEPFPTDPLVQLRMAIEAVFVSWWGKRAHGYRVADRGPGNCDAGDLCSVRRDREAVGTPLPQHAGHGVHCRERQTLDPSDPGRKAYRPGRRSNCC